MSLLSITYLLRSVEFSQLLANDPVCFWLWSLAVNLAIKPICIHFRKGCLSSLCAGMSRGRPAHYW